MTLSETAALALSFLGRASTAHPKGGERSFYGFKTIALGGVEQTMLVRAADLRKPVLLFLHGGPGSPELPQAVRLSKKIESEFTVVIWDQRGCGKSYAGDLAIEISKDRLVDDAIELVQRLRSEYKQDRILLMGHSWGTILGMNLLAKIPENIALFISVGQVVDFKRNEELSYRRLLSVVKEKGAEKDIKTLLEIGAPVDGLYADPIKSLMKQRAILLKHGLVYYGKRDAGEVVKLILLAPEYTLREKLRYGKNQLSIINRMWNRDLMATDFISQLPRVSVPVCFMVGESDFNTPKELVVEYYNKLSAPYKKLVTFSKSGHDPHVEELDSFVKEFAAFVEELKLYMHT